MMQLPIPNSLTAVVHLRLHYEDVNRGDGPSSVELLSKILESAADLSPELQQVLVEFASQVNGVPNGDG